MAVTKIDHIELIVNRFEEYVALFRALGFQERLRTKHHGDSVELVHTDDRSDQTHLVSTQSNRRISLHCGYSRRE